MHASRPHLLLVPFLFTLLTACGSEAEPEVSTSPASTNAPGTGPSRQRPPAPEANFTDRRPVPGPWYADLVERVQPARDGWLTEVVGEAVEDALEATLTRALAGDHDALASVLWREFQGSDPLRPAGSILERPPFLVELAGPPEGDRRIVASDGLAASLGTLVAPFAGATEPRVQVHVTGIVPEERREYLPFEVTAQVRLAGNLGSGSLQVQSTWRMGWGLGAKGKRIGIEWIEVDALRSVHATERPLAELTHAVLAEAGPVRDELLSGSLEFWKRVDRMAVSNTVYLGMHGLGVGDLDGDGREDVYVPQHAGLPNRLLMAGADGHFLEQAARRGVDFLDDTSGVLIVDLDGDGAREIALAVGPTVLLCWNDGSGHFPERTRLVLPGTEQVYSLSAADADGDGDLDLYATRYVAGGVIGGVPTPYHDARNGASNAYFRGEGERTFVDATEEAGLAVDNNRFSLASLWEDFDRDGDLDLYVANDFGRNNLFQNEGGRFVDVAAARGAEDMAAGMGISVADADLDGSLDVYVSNMFTAAGSRVTAQPEFLRGLPIEERAAYGMHTRGNSLLLAGEGGFRDATDEAGVGPGGWAWGAMFMDLQNDGLPDLVVPNGFLTGREDQDLESFFWRGVVAKTPPRFPPTEDYQHAWVAISTMTQREGFSWNGPERNFAYLNLGQGQFVDASAAAGLDHADDARVACVLDQDGDGRLDLWLRNRTAPRLRFLHGRGDTGSWSSVQLIGKAPNTDAVGALVTVTAGETTYRRRRYAGEGYLGCQSQRLHFGLGASTSIDRLRVVWPSGEVQVHEDLPIDRRLVLREGSEAATVLEPVPSPMADFPSEPIPAGRRESLQRVPLLDNLPLAPLRLPRFEGGERPLVELLPERVLVVLWATYDETSEAVLADLAAASGRLDEARVVVHPLTLDEVADLEGARAAAMASGLAEPGGRLDRRARSVLEGVLIEVLGGFSDLPLPVGILFDGTGAVSVLHVGGIDPEAVARDAELLGEDAGAPGWRWPTQLTGGQWLDEGPTRSFGPFGKFLRGAGFAELAAEVARAARERGAE